MREGTFKRYFSIVLTIGILLVGLMHLPQINLHSLDGLFSMLWFALGGTIVLANYISITKIEKQSKVPRGRKMRRRA